MRGFLLLLIFLMASGCATTFITGNTGVYVESSGIILPYYQTTVIEGNTYTDFRHFAKITATSDNGKSVNSKAKLDGTYIIKVKHTCNYTIRAEFTEDLFIEKRIEVKENDTTELDLIVK